MFSIYMDISRLRHVIMLMRLRNFLQETDMPISANMMERISQIGLTNRFGRNSRTGYFRLLAL